MNLPMPATAMCVTLLLFCGEVPSANTSTSETLPHADGYQGIWYSNEVQNDEYKFKYSGGFATYPQQHIPIAIYRKEVNRTFFCYGGTVPGKQELLHMVSYFDHATSTVPRPRILLNKKTGDAHDNPVMAIDEKGYIFIFSPAHGTGRPTFLNRSVEPYNIDRFETLPLRNFSYPQIWHVPGKGFVFLHTRYDKGRSLYVMNSEDGEHWTSGSLLSRIAEGHYQISGLHEGTIYTAFNYHPKPGGLNARTNLYFLQSSDLGKTWTTAAGTPVEIPVTTTATAALVHDYQAEGLLVYMKDLNFDAEGQPVVLYMTSRGYKSGPENDPRTWHIAHWTGSSWQIRDVTKSDSNYDYGSLYIEEDGTWRIIAPTVAGPQPYNPGGEIAMWVSKDKGVTWSMARQLTQGSTNNHTYVRRPRNAHPDFYALWADGNGRAPSDSSLYFTNREGGGVWKLPFTMNEETTVPEQIR